MPQAKAGNPARVDIRSLGQVVQVLETGANDVYVVRGSRGEILVPAVDDQVIELDLESKRMVVCLLPGMGAEEGA